MRTERGLTVLALACAFLLLLAPLTPRTTWVGGEARGRDGASTVTHSAGWDWVAPLCGVVVAVGVLAGRSARSRAVAVLIVALAAGAFAVAAAAAGGHWHDAMSGSLNMQGYVIHPAHMAPLFALIAVIGAGTALALAYWRARATD